MMQNLNYSESTLSTTNTKLAAVLMLFGFKLKQHQPFEWNDEFASKELYFKSRKDRSIKPTVKVTWNFEVAGVNAREIVTAFSAKDQDVRFNQLVDEVVTDPKLRAEVKAAHSAAVTQGAREVLDHRDFLIRLFREIPELGKWIVVFNDRGQYARFGRNASIETQTQLLSRI
jgi:hypothetical protein